MILSFLDDAVYTWLTQKASVAVYTINNRRIWHEDIKIEYLFLYNSYGIICL